MTQTTGKGRGFKSMTVEQRRIIASKGGKEAHRLQHAHQWTAGPDGTAREAGRRGGAISKRRPKVK